MGSTSAIRVLIADDNDSVRLGLSLLLDLHDNLTLVGEAVDGATAIALCRLAQPDVVIMDVMMPEMNGIEATRVLIAENPDLKIILLSSYLDTELLLEARAAGAIRYLSKSASTHQLLEAIYAAGA